MGCYKLQNQHCGVRLEVSQAVGFIRTSSQYSLPTGDETVTSAQGTGSTQMLNPPMVHGLAIMGGDSRVHDRLVACARGDGCVAVYDLDRTSKDRKQKEEHTQLSEPVFCARCHSAAVSSM